MRFSSLLTLMGTFLNLSAIADLVINGARLQLPVLEQVQEEVSYGFQRWCSEVHLNTEAPLCKNGPLCLIDGSG